MSGAGDPTTGHHITSWGWIEHKYGEHEPMRLWKFSIEDEVDGEPVDEVKLYLALPPWVDAVDALCIAGTAYHVDDNPNATGLALYEALHDRDAADEAPQ